MAPPPIETHHAPASSTRHREREQKGERTSRENRRVESDRRKERVEFDSGCRFTEGRIMGLPSTRRTSRPSFPGAKHAMSNLLWSRHGPLAHPRRMKISYAARAVVEGARYRRVPLGV